jgi:uncharacterized membrane protein (UPF0136 family)
MLHLVQMYLFVFGAITVAGGVIGFVKAKSKASIIAGGISGALLVVAGALVGGANTTVALALGFVVSLALLGRFGNAYRKTKKVMPAGLIAALSLGGIVLTLLAFR